MNEEPLPHVPAHAEVPTLAPGQIRLIGKEESFRRISQSTMELFNTKLRGTRQDRRWVERKLRKLAIRVVYGPPLLDFTLPVSMTPDAASAA